MYVLFQAVQQILEHLELDQASYRLGLSQVFFRAGGMAQLEEAREEKITDTIKGIQAHCRGYITRQRLKKLKVCCRPSITKFLVITNSWLFPFDLVI